MSFLLMFVAIVIHCGPKPLSGLFLQPIGTASWVG